MKEYILKGDPAEVEKVIRENRIRISRGVISITPAEPEASEAADSMKTLSASLEIAHKECDRLQGSLLELSELTRKVVLIEVEAGGQTIPEDLTSRLAEFGIIIPKIDETAGIPGVDGEKTTENVPSVAETEIDEETMDDKNPYAEDFKEVDLDADTKEVPDEDKKGAPAEDIKEATPPKKITRSKKKSE